MEQRIVKSIQRQLKGLADGIGGADDEQAAVLMAQAGASLMANCVRLCEKTLGSMSEGSFTDVMDACTLVARRTADMMESPRCAALQDQSRMIAVLRQQVESASAAGQDMELQIELLRGLVSEKERELTIRRRDYFQILEAQKEVDKEAEAAEDKNIEAMNQLESLRKKKRELDSQWSALEPQIQQRAGEISDMERLLERLRTRMQDFTPERQTQLREEADALQKQMQEDERAVACLNDALSGLRRSEAQLKDERSMLEGEALDVIQSALSRLDAASGQRLNALQEAQTTVNTLSERFEQCRSLHADYESWLDANGAAMDELARILGENDPLNGSLRKTLDPAQTARLRQLRDSVQESLKQMDELLAPCIRLMSSNRRALLDKVSQGPGRGEAAQ